MLTGRPTCGQCTLSPTESSFSVSRKPRAHDGILTLLVAPYLKLPVNQEAVRSVTRGLVGDTSFAVLPDISPRVTATLTLAAQIVSQPHPVQSRHANVLKACTAQGLLLADVGRFCRSNHSLQLCIVSFRLACARKGHSPRHNSLQFAGGQRSPLSRSVPPSCGFWPCVAFPTPLHHTRVSDQDRVHHSLADPVPAGV